MKISINSNSTVIFIILMIMSSATVNAQRIRFGFDAALVHVPQAENSAGVFLNGEYLFDGSAGVGFEIGMLERTRFVEDSYPPIEGGTDRWTITLNGIYYLNSGKKIRPYGSLAAGMASFKYKDGENVNGSVEYTIDRQYSMKIKPELGVRINWFNAGVAYSYIGSYDSPWNAEQLDYSAMEYSIGLRCNLSGGK